MEKRDGFVELRLDRWTAGGFEIDRADVFRRHTTMLVLLRKRGLHEQRTQATGREQALHKNEPPPRRVTYVAPK